MKKLSYGLGLFLGWYALAATQLEWSDSGIKGPKYDALVRYMDELSASNTDLIEVIDYGRSIESRPLRMMLYANRRTSVSSRPTLIISGSTHGNEYLNLEDRLPAEFLRRIRSRTELSQFMDEGGAVLFIPILNPDGYEARERGNSNGVDLNRDWDLPPAGFKGFSEVETRSLSQKLEELTHAPYYLNYRVSVDYHCCIGALLFPWSYTSDIKIPPADEARFRAIGALVKQAGLDVKVGTTPEILGYKALGTTKDYYYHRYGTLGFTYEGQYKKEKDFLPKHVAWWESVVASVRRNSDRGFSLWQNGSWTPYFQNMP